MAQYRFAYTRQHTIIDIQDVAFDQTERDGPYTCVGCEQPVIAKIKGDKRVKHFAHKARVTCNEETYLHRLAKHTFYREYQLCLDTNTPYYIALNYERTCANLHMIRGLKCTIGTLTKKHDLTVYFDGIKLETRDGQFIPDVLIYSTKKPDEHIYIEIAVTHFLSQEKRESAHRIIEIPIEAETDIERLRSRYLTEDDATFINFLRESSTIPDAECRCSNQQFLYFIVYESGKVFMDNDSWRTIQAKHKKLADKIHYFKIHPHPVMDGVIDYKGAFFRFLREAHHQGFRIKNCALCRYAGRSWDDLSDQPIFCRKKREACQSNAAVACPHFWLLPDDELR